MSQIKSVGECDMYLAVLQELRLELEDRKAADLLTLSKFMGKQIEQLRSMIKTIGSISLTWEKRSESLDLKSKELSELQSRLQNTSETQTAESIRLQQQNLVFDSKKRSFKDQVKKDGNAKITGIQDQLEALTSQQVEFNQQQAADKRALQEAVLKTSEGRIKAAQTATKLEELMDMLSLSKDETITELKRSMAASDRAMAAEKKAVVAEANAVEAMEKLRAAGQKAESAEERAIAAEARLETAEAKVTTAEAKTTAAEANMVSTLKALEAAGISKVEFEHRAIAAESNAAQAMKELQVAEETVRNRNSVRFNTPSEPPSPGNEGPVTKRYRPDSGWYVRPTTWEELWREVDLLMSTMEPRYNKATDPYLTKSTLDQIFADWRNASDNYRAYNQNIALSQRGEWHCLNQICSYGLERLPALDKDERCLICAGKHCLRIRNSRSATYFELIPPAVVGFVGRSK